MDPCYASVHEWCVMLCWICWFIVIYHPTSISTVHHWLVMFCYINWFTDDINVLHPSVHCWFVMLNYTHQFIDDTPCDTSNNSSLTCHIVLHPSVHQWLVMLCYINQFIVLHMCYTNQFIVDIPHDTSISSLAIYHVLHPSVHQWLVMYCYNRLFINNINSSHARFFSHGHTPDTKFLLTENHVYNQWV